MIRTLNIDIETYSPVDLIKSGVYAYSEHPEFEILLFAYAFDAGQVKVIDIASGEKVPEEVMQAMEDETVLKTAFNASFERTCIDNFFGLWLPTEQWECTMVKSAMCGLPLSLAAVANVLKLEQKKMVAGKALIRYFSLPCKPTKANGMRVRNLPTHDTDKWNTFKVYCGQDVEVERAIRSKIKFFEIPEFEKRLYILDQDINDRGVMLDREFIQNAISIDITSKERLTAEAIQLTGLDNPNSTAQLKQWIGNETGEEVKSLSKETIPALLENSGNAILTKVLQIRQEMAKTSVKKYEAMSNAICSDSRVRGLLQFYGANRTGRWAGRLVQVQNLPQNHLFDLDLARKLVSENDIEMLEILFGNIPDTLSQLIRTAFVAKAGCTFLVADFSAIEARVIAWLAGEKWRLNVFNTHGKIYEASASQMFKVPIESVVKGSPLRQKGKISELALGYQGGVGALTTMEALKMGLEESELQGLVNAWRLANPAIVRLWDEVGKAAMEAVENGAPVAFHHGIRFECRNNLLYIQLPSGRKLSYVRPSISSNKFGSNALKYEGMNQTTKQWCVQDTYGGKLVENIVQAIARDLLAEAMINVENAGYKIVCHVHDEVIIECEIEKANLEEVCTIMGQPISWAPGLPLRADGYETEYYKKD
jgi:DNA polymerase